MRLKQEGGLVGGLAWPGHYYPGLCLLSFRLQHFLDCGGSGQMVNLIATGHSIFNERHPVPRFARCFPGPLHHRDFIHRAKAQGIYSVFYFCLYTFDHHLYFGQLGSGQSL
jgi:hypothetical protein